MSCWNLLSKKHDLQYTRPAPGHHPGYWMQLARKTGANGPSSLQLSSSARHGMGHPRHAQSTCQPHPDHGSHGPRDSQMPLVIKISVAAASF